MPVEEEYELIIVGAGVAGVFTGYFATEKKFKTLLLEKDRSPDGATPRSGGVVTRMMDNPLDSELAAESIEIIRGFLRSDSEIINDGYISIEDEDDAERDLEKFKELIPDIEIMDAAEVMSRWSYIKLYHDEVGLYSPSDLTLNPFKLLKYMWNRLMDRGVDLQPGKRVTRLIIKENRVRGVETHEGDRYYSDKVVLASGPWNREILKSHGIDLNVWLIGVPIFKFEVDRTKMVGVWDENIYSYWRPENSHWIGGVYDSFPIEKADDGFRKPDDEAVKRILEGFRYRFKFSQWRLIDSWSGPISISHDYKPICREIDEVRGLYIIDGLGGRGLMRGPALAKKLIERIIS